MNKFLLFASLFFIKLSFSLTCVDQNGNSVEWWMIQQIPEIEKNYSGYSHVYIDSTMQQATDFQYFQSDPDATGIVLKQVKLNILGTALYNTIQTTYNSNYMKILWNDEDPITGTVQYAPTAHSKGLIVLDSDSDSGFYLLHSFPKYPNVVNSKIDPTIGHGQRYYGQNGLCMSAKGSELEKIAQNMLIIEADVYWTQSLSSNYPNLYKLGKQQVPSSPLYSIANISLIQGTQMTLFSKSGKLEDYIYEQIMVPYFKFSLYCESWGHPYYQYAWCNCTSNDYFVKEILEVQLTSNNVYWSSYNDHAKWAISATGDSPFVCSGDLNKMLSQNKRGGNYMCMQNTNLWNLFSSIVYKHQSCEQEVQ